MLTNGYWLQMKMSQSQHMVAYTSGDFSRFRAVHRPESRTLLQVMGSTRALFSL